MDHPVLGKVVLRDESYKGVGQMSWKYLPQTLDTGGGSDSLVQQIFIKHTMCAEVSVLGSGDVAENKSKSVLEAVVSWVRQMVNKETGK